MQTNVREEFRRKKKQGWVLKLDLEKAYDRTDWDFLDYVLARKGFDPSWRKWKIGCLSSSQFSIIINDTPTTRGLRQGLIHPYQDSCAWTYMCVGSSYVRAVDISSS